MRKKTVAVLAVIWIVILTAVVSSGLTMLLAGGTAGYSVSLASGMGASQRYSRLDEVRSILLSDYYVELDEEELLTGAVRGMLSSIGDPYTFYYTADEMKRSNEMSDGVYHGVGMVVQLNEDGTIQVIQVYEGSPAEAAGILDGDLIVAVDGVQVETDSQKAYEDSIARISGEDGTPVVITVERDGVKMDLTAVRAEVTVSHVEREILDDDIGYVRITQFSGDDVDGFSSAIAAFKDAGVRGMIVDLRDNPGGYLDHVVQICDQVLPEGLVTYYEDRQGKRGEEYSTANYWDVPMVVLVNGNSASGSELFTAAVQDYERGTVIGTTTFGKGIVQTVIPFSDGAGMQLTTASYYSPKGRSIHQVGVEPDIVIEYDGSDGTDNQLAAAIQALKDSLDEDAQAA